MQYLFYNNSTRQWHFKELLKEAKISRPQLSIWIGKLMKEGIIRRVKPRRKMPYYIGDYASPAFKAAKKAYAYSLLQKSGFLSHLASLKNAKAAVIFGSFARSDWHSGSDIDLFIYGDAEGLQLGEYELKLKREIQLFEFNNKEELKERFMNVIPSVLEGHLVKGDYGFLKVDI